MKKIKLIYEEPQSKEVSEYVGGCPEGQLVNLSMYEVEGGGFVFTYDNCHDNHDMYSNGDGEPFATQQEAYETATWITEDSTHPSASWMEDYDIVQSW